MAESALCHVRASVMMYDSEPKRWFPCAGSGISRVNIYQHSKNQTFRVVGRKLDTQEISVNCAILKGLIYNEATATFHQWRHNGVVYGLNFLSQEEAQVFSGWMNKALDFVCGRIAWPCEVPDYPQQTAQKQVEPLRSVPQQTVYERNQETHDNMVINQYHSEIRPGAQYSHEQKPSGQPSNTESGKTSQLGQGGLIENGLSVHSSQGYQSNQSRQSANSAHSTHSSHSSTQSGQRVGSGQIEAHLSQLSLANRPVTINTGYNLPTSTIAANNSLLTEIRTGTNLRPVNQNGNNPRAQPTGPNFNDELKRRLADRQGRKIESPAGPEKNQRVDSSDYSSEPSPDVADKSQKLASGQVDDIRRAIRSELSQFRTELFSQFRDVIRSEIRNLQADSNH